ncbi:hypothetical protein NRB_28260 [Novosphingobium sp. 11B]
MTIKADRTEFAGKRVLVSGGTKGAGRATVDRFLAGGARVITAARGTPEPIDGVEFVQADLATPEGSKALADAALERLGGIDILAHVIGGSSTPGGGFVALTDEHWLAELSLNLLATVRLDRLLVPKMIEQGAGEVVPVFRTGSFNRKEVKGNPARPSSVYDCLIADGLVIVVFSSASISRAGMSFVGYRVVYAVETRPPQDRSSWAGIFQCVKRTCREMMAMRPV